MLYIFMVDTEFAVFHNLPPRMAVVELNLDMPSSEKSFSATTADICRDVLQEEGARRPKTLAPLIAMFLGEQWDEKSYQMAQDLSVLSLFIVILGIFPQSKTIRTLELIFSLRFASDSLAFQTQHAWPRTCRSNSTSSCTVEVRMGRSKISDYYR
jgi:hypothetical protein